MDNLPSAPLLWAVFGLALLACCVLAAMAVRYRRRAVAEAARGADLRRREQYLALAMWASGEQFWEYDLRREELLHVRVDGEVAHSSEARMLVHRDKVPAIHPDDIPLAAKRLHSHLAGQTRRFVSEHRIDLKGDGDWLWIQAWGRITKYDAEGKPTHLAGAARDFSAERRIASERQIASEVLGNMSEAVAVLDRGFHFLSINPAFTRITGYLESEVAGQPLSLLDSQRDPSPTPAQMAEQIERDGHHESDAWKVRKDGGEILCHLRNTTIRDARGERSFHVVVLSDITEQKRAEQELRYLANYDALTGLPNRSLLLERLARTIVRARRHGHRIAVLFLDLDRFKNINDSLGHAVGDRVLRATATRLQQAVGYEHTVARLSGDEFTVVLDELADAGQAEATARHIIETFAQPLILGEGREVTLSPSIGISLFPDHALTPNDLIKHADTAMYHAKAAGRRTHQGYSPWMDEKARRRATLASQLHRALQRDELRLVHQPLYSLREHRICGAEALMRWQHPELGPVAPMQFIPLAEDSGLILEIGEWALQQACRTLREWQRAGFDGLRMSVNISALQLQRCELARQVEGALAGTGIRPSLIELELTESVIMADVARSASVLSACRELGMGVAIDDFGTGYSSLSYLKRLPISALKIDRSFVGDLTRDADDEAITSTIITMGHSLGLNIVAEGVETEDQLAFLQQRGCDEIQGYLVSRPLEPEDFLHYLRQPHAPPFASGQRQPS